MISILRHLVGGFLMGTADLVPGVSGGTIALVLGIYERLVSSIREGSSALGGLVRGRIDDFKTHLGRVEWVFLVPLLGGIGLAILSLSRLLEHQLETNPTVLAGGFFGLVLGSVAIAWGLLKRPGLIHVLVALTVGGILFWVLGFGEDATVNDPGLFVYFGAGALAICAMILPGISGSLILLLIGMYANVLGAVNDRDFAALGVFILGAIVGLALFSQVLHWALSRYHDLVLAGLIGLMAGSLRVLWPWPNGVDSAALGAPGDDVVAVLIAAAVGLVVVFGISRLAADSDRPAPVRQIE